MNLSRASTAGATCWASATPLFLAANVVVGLAWHHPSFSWATNNVSDLGNVHCGTWDTTRPRYVCSPWHTTMDVSMVLTAALLAVGAILTWRACGRGAAVRTAQSLVLLGALGLGAAGARPADVDENTHFLGALLLFCLGNLGLLVAGFARRDTVLGRYRMLSLALGTVAVAGVVLFFAQQGLGLGVGGMERVAAFPLPVWASSVGLLLLRRSRTDVELLAERLGTREGHMS